MKSAMINKISGLTFCGFYDPSKEMVTVHFFNEGSDKADIIAYLRKDMSWDVREILSEESHLYENSEAIIMRHNKLCVEEQGSSFDEFIRLGLEKMARQVHGKDADLTKADKVFEILEKNSYE